MNFGIRKLYIDGVLSEASSATLYDLVCPANEEVIGQISWAGKEDAERALISAEKGFRTWSALPLMDRLEWIGKLREAILAKSDLLRESIMAEMGKTWEGTAEDLNSITDSLEYYSDEIQKIQDIPIPDREGTHEHYIRHQPIGVVVAFLAYNFPLLNLGFKLGPALAAGCSIILKPSEFSPLSAYLIGEICAEIQFPKGVINVLCGPVAEVGATLSESKIPALITMIGSTGTAQKLIAQSSRTSIKRYSMECGGNAPFIVFEDADMDLAVQHAVDLKIGNSGQICVAPNRFYIQEAVVEVFSERVITEFKKVNMGFGQEPQPDMGPLANKQSVQRMSDIVEEAISQGGELLVGGKAKEGLGYYFYPTVIVLKDQNAPVLQKEIFGPVALIVPFSNQEEVCYLANNTEAGLASYIYSADESKLAYFAEKLEFGEVHMNGLKFGIYLPHGGIKNSGIGVDCSPRALDDYLVKKRITRALN